MLLIEQTGFQTNSKESSADETSIGGFERMSCQFFREQPSIDEELFRVLLSEPGLNRGVVPNGAIRVHKSYKAYDPDLRFRSRRTGKTNVNVHCHLGEPETTRRPSSVERSEPSSVTLDVNTEIGAFLCCFIESAKRISEAIKLVEVMGTRADNVESEKLLRELTTQAFILDFLQRNQARCQCYCLCSPWSSKIGNGAARKVG